VQATAVTAAVNSIHVAALRLEQPRRRRDRSVTIAITTLPSVASLLVGASRQPEQPRIGRLALVERNAQSHLVRLGLIRRLSYPRTGCGQVSSALGMGTRTACGRQPELMGSESLLAGVEPGKVLAVDRPGVSAARPCRPRACCGRRRAVKRFGRSCGPPFCDLTTEVVILLAESVALRCDRVGCAAVSGSVYSRRARAVSGGGGGHAGLGRRSVGGGERSACGVCEFGCGCSDRLVRMLRSARRAAVVGASACR
jgi:hypothetical protein